MKTLTATHTPIPWKVYETMSDDVGIYSEENFECITDSIFEEDAAYIVRCVNSHQELLNALKQVQIIVDAQGGMDRIGIAIAKAIAKAEGK